MSYQQLTIVGNLGRDPELRYTPNGSAVCSFSVAVNESYVRSTGEKVDNTIWFRIAAWGKMGEACSKYLAKGRPVLVVGRLNGDPATGGPKIYQRNDGNPGASFELNAATVKFLGGKSADAGDDANPASDADDIPFE